MSDELVSFGPRAHDLIAAVGGVTKAPTTYVMILGESFAHFHVLIAAGGLDVAEDRRTGDILKFRLENADSDAALALIPAVRSADAAIRDELVDGSMSHMHSGHAVAPCA